MSWDVESWDRFLDTARQIAIGRRQDWRNSFLLYPYEPSAEVDALVHVQNAIPQIGTPPVTTEVLSWGALLASFLKQQGFLNRGVTTAEEVHRLQQNLGTRLPEYLAKNTAKILAGKPRTHVAFIVRTGAIFPFTTISQTLAACERTQVQATLAILGPGTYFGRTTQLVQVRLPILGGRLRWPAGRYSTSFHLAGSTSNYPVMGWIHDVR